jgi:hypothetical protein
LNTSPCRYIRKVFFVCIGAKRDAETSCWIRICINIFRASGNAEVCTIICPLGAAVEGIFNTLLEVSITPCTRVTYSHADPRQVLSEMNDASNDRAISSLVTIEWRRALIDAIICCIETEKGRQDRADDHTDVLPSGDIRVISGSPSG